MIGNVGRLGRLLAVWLSAPVVLASLIVASVWAGSLGPCAENNLFVACSFELHFELHFVPVLDLPAGIGGLVAAGVAIVGARRMRSWRRGGP